MLALYDASVHIDVAVDVVVVVVPIDITGLPTVSAVDHFLNQ